MLKYNVCSINTKNINKYINITYVQTSMHQLQAS